MSVCDGVILSVGTFGWWAGYLSSQYGGDVVYFKNNFNMKQGWDGDLGFTVHYENFQ